MKDPAISALAIKTIEEEKKSSAGNSGPDKT